MKEKQTVLDFELGGKLRDEAMARVEAHASSEWRAAASKAIADVARAKPFFTADHVWATGLARPHESRALGPEIKRAARAGVLEPTDTFKLSAQASRHRAPIRVWRSLVCATPGVRKPRLADVREALAEIDAYVAGPDREPPQGLLAVRRWLHALSERHEFAQDDVVGAYTKVTDEGGAT